MNPANWNPAELLNLSGSYWATCTLHAGVKLDLFTPLAEKTRSAGDLAEAKGLDVRALEMLLNALAAMGLLEKRGDHFAAVPAAARYLAKNSPDYLGYMILHHHHLVASWSRLDEAVRTGGPVRDRISHEPTDQERESFQMGMFNLAMLIAPKVVPNIDLAGRRRLLDLGGGPGTWAIHFCRHNPGLEAVIFDLPTTRPFAEQTVARFGLSDRIRFVAGDFTVDPLPDGCDVAWLSLVLHGESPVSAARLLARTVEALEPGGLLLVQEFLLAADRIAPEFPALFSLNMLLGTPQGQAYSEPELVEMMRQAGLKGIERLPLELPNGVGILVGRKG
ncbi:ubiquinone/menaquinone biosynthesis C-methylase UbiE [Geothermobacter ehrlichii]|uniref:Ubiquinone/menaquinone biosynthesis C-methylase UbiE n=1 Tax=Geothermobacter ehrlichii TaxID=213224 RepID=A0A5D3WM74_9BACT|nr:ubiquinone/menaquinone biosynthesis C-methylase UbiE [Geothermobacter ehrlichii]